MSVLTRVGIVVAVVGVLFVGIGWNRYQHDSSANDMRRQRIDQAERLEGPAGAALYAERVQPYPDDLWLAVLVAAGAAALVGAGLVVAGRRTVTP